jgi:histone acetyltransferase (RNA polymerase elongator complex component)
MKERTFEQGPIRPPSEAGSLLLRFTRNCPWNQCTFCPVYKGKPFSRRTLAEIKRDIDAVSGILEDLESLSRVMGYDGSVTRQVLSAVFTSSPHDTCRRQVAYWRYTGKGAVFIQDANSLVLPAEILAEALRYLKEKVGGISRITSYARSSTLAKKSAAELAEIRAAGLDRIHIGLESGSDRVLELVRKGATARQHIQSGRKVIEAGMELSEYVMPGLGGTVLTREHAVETARVLNAINPHFIRLRSLRIPPRAPLFEEKAAGRFTPLSDDETVSEIRLFIESLEGITSKLVSDHIMNLLEDIEGTFPQDKEAMLAVIDRYLSLSEEDRQLFRLGRRGGGLRSVDDLEDPATRNRLGQARRELEAETGMNMERLITELGDQYI